MPLLFSKSDCVGCLTTHIELMTMEGVVWRGLRFMVLSEKTWKSNHMRMWLQSRKLSISYFKTLSDGPAGVQLVRGVFRGILVVVLVVLTFYQTLNFVIDF